MIDKFKRQRRKNYRYSLGTGFNWRRSVSAVFAIVLLVSSASTVLRLIGPSEIVDAASGSATGLYPNADYGTFNNFGSNGGTVTNGGTCTNNAHHCNYVDDNDTGSSTYLGTGTGSTDLEEEFEIEDFTVSGTFNHITSVSVYVDALTVACRGGGSPCDGMSVGIFVGGGYESAQNVTLGTTVTEHTFTFSGLEATNQNDLRVEIKRIVNGTGSPGAKGDDVRISEVRVDVTYDFTAPPAAYTQEAYIFENDDEDGATDATAQAGSEFSSPTTLESIQAGEVTNLRIHLENDSNGQITSENNVSLFYDRNDNMWSKVDGWSQLINGGGSCSDTSFDCEAVDATDDVGEGAAMAINNLGYPAVSYFDDTNDAIYYAEYVGTNGTGCNGGSTAWTCSQVDTSSGQTGNVYTALAFDSTDTPWVAFNDHTTNDQLNVCSRSGASWVCEAPTAATSEGEHASLGFDNQGVLWVAFYDASNTQLEVARRDGGGSGNCNDTDWNCETVDNAAAVGEYTSIAHDANGTTHVSHYDATNDSLKLAIRDGDTGGSNRCTDTDWECTEIDDVGGTSGVGQYTSLAIDPSGDPWISYYDVDNTKLKIAEYVGTGGSGCTGGTSTTTWICSDVDDAASTDIGSHNSLVFTPGGLPAVSYYDATNFELQYAVCIGDGADSGTARCNADVQDANAEWVTYTVDSSGSDAIGESSSLAIDPDGNPWIAYYDGGTEQNLRVADFLRQGEITITNSQALDDGDSLSESHADMTSSTDSSSRDSADCVSATAWSNGTYIGVGNASGVSLAAGDSTTQCTEFMWTLDTSHAVPGETYRFVVAVNDNFAQSKGQWRGPSVINEYPQMTIAGGTNQSVRYSKGLNPRLSGDCSGFGDTSGGATDWDCEVIVNGTDTTDFYDRADIEVDSKGRPNIATIFTSSDGHSSILHVEYVGSGGNCSGFDDTGGSNAWQCTEVINGAIAGDFNQYLDFAIGPNDEKFIIANDFNNRMVVAEYVGSGGDCLDFRDTGGSAAWECTHVVIGDDTEDWERTAIIEVSKDGIPFIAAPNAEGMDSDLIIMYRVGSESGNCANFDAAGGSDDWQCDTIIDGAVSNDNGSTSLTMTIDENGFPMIIVHDFAAANNTTGNDPLLVEYVGSGGNCDTYLESVNATTDAWECSIIIDGNSQLQSDYFWSKSIAIDPSNNPYFVSIDSNVASTGNRLVVAEYTGSGTGSCNGFDDTGGSTDWDCTHVIDGNGDNDFEYYTSIAFDDQGDPWVMSTAYSETGGGTTGNNVIVAEYVGSGGDCDTFIDSSGSSAWECTTVIDGNDVNDYYEAGAMAFDHNGVPWLVTTEYNSSGGNNLVVAKKNVPDSTFSATTTTVVDKGSSNGVGDFQYQIPAGRADYSETDGNCNGNSNYAGYCGLRADDGDYDTLVSGNAFETPYYGMAARFDSNTAVPWLQWSGSSNLNPSATSPAASAGDIVMEIYRFGTTNAWEEVARDSASTSCSTTNCSLSAMPTGTVSEYFETIDSQYWVYIRVYQIIDESTTITFKTDNFNAKQTGSGLHHGAYFRNGEKLPLNRRR